MISALVEATAPVCVERFVDYPQLGRFTLRDEGKMSSSATLVTVIYSELGRTIAIGKVTKLIEGSVDDATDGLNSLSLGNSAASTNA